MTVEINKQGAAFIIVVTAISFLAGYICGVSSTRLIDKNPNQSIRIEKIS